MLVNQEITITSSFICQKSYQRAYKIKGSYCIKNVYYIINNNLDVHFYRPFIQPNLPINLEPWPWSRVHGERHRLLSCSFEMRGRERDRESQRERESRLERDENAFSFDSDYTRIVFITFRGELLLRMEMREQIREREREREAEKKILGLEFFYFILKWGRVGIH
jgi:hypothetical protein